MRAWLAAALLAALAPAAAERFPGAVEPALVAARGSAATLDVGAAGNHKGCPYARGGEAVGTALAAGGEEPQVKLGEPQQDPEKAREAAIERAKEHLCKALGTEAADVQLVSATAATWPDASLGCPEKDRMYAQVVTSGYKVVLEARGKTHEVHVARGRAVVCKPPAASAPSAPRH